MSRVLGARLRQNPKSPGASLKMVFDGPENPFFVRALGFDI
jgi:hypothetical protein